MPKSSKILLLSFSIALVLFAFIGFNLHGVRAESGQASGAYRQITVYTEVLQKIQSDYVVDPNIPAVTNGALRGLLESLDSDSSYLSPDEYKTYKAHEGNGKAQVGLNVSKRFGYAIAVSVLPGSPAEKANITDGDIIESIGTQSTRDLSPAMIHLLLQGQPGTNVTISVVRPRQADPEKVTLTRTNVFLPAVTEEQYENSSILELKPVTLDHERVTQIEQRLKTMSKNGNRKILLDLRDVASGEMSEAVRLANFFISKGTVATLQGQKFPEQVFTAEPGKAINTTAPMVVLVNHGTSGAAELVAAALLDDKRADLVGDKTFGDGSQQKTIELPDHAALILTVAQYERPSGKVIEDEGITPNVVVASNLDMEADDDSESPEGQPTRAATSVTQPQTAPAAKPQPHVDDQLNKALELLKSKPV